MQHKSVSCGDTECRQKPGEAKTNWILIDYDSMINFCRGSRRVRWRSGVDLFRWISIPGVRFSPWGQASELMRIGQGRQRAGKQTQTEGDGG